MAARRALGLRRAARLAAGRADAELPEETEAERRLRRRQETAVRLRRLQRLLEPPGPPERTLSRRAMEQIRHLSQEFPEDWPVSRLARGFQVQPDVVRRVLRSRFSPSLERSLKQDGQVWAKRRGGSGGPHPAPLTRESTSKLLPASSGRGGAPWHAAPQGPSDSPAPEALPGEEAGRGPVEPWGTSGPEGGRQLEEGQGTPMLSIQKMEQLAAEGWESQLCLVQRDREFFDEAGNLLYRIPAAPSGD